MTDLPKKARLTDAMAAKFPFLASGQKLVADADQPGLYLKVGKTAKSWVVQTEVRTLDDRMRKVRKTVRRDHVNVTAHVSRSHARAALRTATSPRPYDCSRMHLMPTDLAVAHTRPRTLYTPQSSDQTQSECVGCTTHMA